MQELPSFLPNLIFLKTYLPTCIILQETMFIMRKELWLNVSFSVRSIHRIITYSMAACVTKIYWTRVIGRAPNCWIPSVADLVPVTGRAKLGLTRQIPRMLRVWCALKCDLTLAMFSHKSLPIFGSLFLTGD